MRNFQKVRFPQQMKRYKNNNQIIIDVEPFKKALGDTSKALADSKDIEVQFSTEKVNYKDGSVTIPQISKRMTINEILASRGSADAHAFRNKHSNKRLRNFTAVKMTTWFACGGTSGQTPVSNSTWRWFQIQRGLGLLPSDLHQTDD